MRRAIFSCILLIHFKLFCVAISLLKSLLSYLFNYFREIPSCYSRLPFYIFCNQFLKNSFYICSFAPRLAIESSFKVYSCTSMLSFLRSNGLPCFLLILSLLQKLLTKLLRIVVTYY